MSHDLQQSTSTPFAMTIRHVFFSLGKRKSEPLYKSQFTNIVNMMDIKITVNLVGLSLLKYTCPMSLIRRRRRHTLVYCLHPSWFLH